MEEGELFKQGWIKASSLRDAMLENGFTKRHFDAVLRIIAKKVGLEESVAAEQVATVFEHVDWSPCSEGTHTWKKTGDRYYRCTTCRVGGYTKVNASNPGHTPYHPNVQVYKCPHCKGPTTEKEAFCPVCLNNREEGEQRAEVQLRWETLSPGEQKALLFLQDGRSGYGTVPVTEGAHHMAKLAKKGLVCKAGDRGGQTVWELMHQGAILLRNR